MLVAVLAASPAAADQSRGVEDVAALVAEVAPEAGEVAGLDASRDTLNAVANDVEIVLPVDATDAIVVTEVVSGGRTASAALPEKVSVEISLPREVETERAEVSEDGAVVYAGTDGETDLVVQALETGSVRVQTVSNGPDAPTAYTYTFGDDVLPVVLDDGTVSLTVPSGNRAMTIEVGTIAQPWAFDAAGASVPTSYEVRDGALIQHVRHDPADVTYPVVADPTYSSGWGSYWHFDRAETKTWASYGVTGIGVAGGACAAVGGLGGPIGSVLAGASCGYIAARMIHAAGVAENSSPKKCFYVRMTVPALAGISAGTYRDSRCR